MNEISLYLTGSSAVSFINNPRDKDVVAVGLVDNQEDMKSFWGNKVNIDFLRSLTGDHLTAWRYVACFINNNIVMNCLVPPLCVGIFSPPCYRKLIYGRDIFENICLDSGTFGDKNQLKRDLRQWLKCNSKILYITEKGTTDKRLWQLLMSVFAFEGKDRPDKLSEKDKLWLIKAHDYDCPLEALEYIKRYFNII